MEVSNKEKQIIHLCNGIEEIAKKYLQNKEYIFISHNLRRRNFDVVRAYTESCVLKSQNNVLYNIYNNGDVTEEQKIRYRFSKLIDNKITYICQELI